jgi:Flp pilus assembly protein TadD
VGEAVEAAIEERKPNWRGVETPGPGADRWGWLRFLLKLVCGGLVVFCTWWVVHDLWLLPRDLKEANRLQARGDRDGSIRVLRGYLQRSPDAGEVRMALARKLAQAGDLAGCAAELGKVPTWWPRKREALYLQGQVLNQLDRAQAFEAAWLACVEGPVTQALTDEMLISAGEGLLGLYVLEERPAEAAKVTWSIFRQWPEELRPRALIMRLRTATERIDPKEAVAMLRRYVTADPADWHARRALARASQAVGDIEQADQQIARCIAERPEDPRGWADRLQILDVRQDRAGLLQAVAEIPPRVQEDARIAQYRGMALESTGDLEGAASAYRRSIALDAYREEVHYLLAGVEQRLGRTEQAQRERELHQGIVRARKELPVAVLSFQDALDRSGMQDPAVRAAAQRVSEICRVLGFERDAAEWQRLAGDGGTGSQPAPGS